MKRDSFIFYASYLNAANLMKPKERDALYRAIIEYGILGVEPQLTGTALACWQLIEPQIKANNRKYKNGKLGGRPSSTKAEQEITTGFPDFETTGYFEEKPNDNVNDNVNVNVNATVNDNDNVLEKTSVSDDTEEKKSGKKKSTPKPKPDYFKELAGDDKELLDALKAFNEMRVKIKKPMTEKAKKMLCDKLNKNFQPCEWVAILNQSIYNGWQDIYELKGEKAVRAAQSMPWDKQESALDDQFARVAANMGVDW